MKRDSLLSSVQDPSACGDEDGTSSTASAANRTTSPLANASGVDGARERHHAANARGHKTHNGNAGHSGTSARTQSGSARSIEPGTVRLPQPPASIAASIVYPESVQVDFATTAVVLGHLSPQQAADLKDEAERTNTQPTDAARATRLLTDAQIVIIEAKLTATIQVDQKQRNAPAFLTWLDDLKRRGIPVKLETYTARELSEIQRLHAPSATDAGDQQTRAAVRRLLIQCAKLRVSDLHLMIGERSAEIQIRIDGTLWTVKSESLFREKAVAYSRVLSGGLAVVKDTYKENEVQDAQIHGKELAGAGVTSIRVIRGPSYPVELGGSFLVARFQYESHGHAADPSAYSDLELVQPSAPAGVPRFDKLGFTPLQVGLIEQILYRDHGLWYITGPVNSGKTTTLYEVAKYLAQLYPGSRMVAVEDPTEYPMPWAIQITAKGEHFPDAVKQILRMDPDSAVVGEQRSGKEAGAAMQIALIGKLGFTTLHVNDPYYTILRLEQFDQKNLPRTFTCDPELIIALSAQRLVPLLCTHCRVPLAERPNALPLFIREPLATWGPLENVYVRGDGCEHCQGKGHRGRTMVAEIVLTTDDLMHDIVTHGVHVARMNHRMREGSDKSLLGNVIEHVFAGLVDPVDAHRRVHRIVPKKDGV